MNNELATLTAADVAQLAGCDVETVLRAARSGKLDSIGGGKGRPRAFTPEAVERWAQSKTGARRRVVQASDIPVPEIDWSHVKLPKQVDDKAMDAVQAQLARDNPHVRVAFKARGDVVSDSTDRRRMEHANETGRADVVAEQVSGDASQELSDGALGERRDAAASDAWAEESADVDAAFEQHSGLDDMDAGLEDEGIENLTRRSADTTAPRGSARWHRAADVLASGL